jgi:hypothetical protein
MSELYFKRISLLLFFGILVVSFSVNFVKKFQLTDDNLYLYHSISTVVSHNSKAIQLENDILQQSLKVGAIEQEEFSSRWKMRSEYAGNYLISLYLYSYGNEIGNVVSGNKKSDSRFIIKVIASFLLPFLLFSILLIGFITTKNDPHLFLAFLFTTIVIYFSNEYFPRGGQNLFDYGVGNFFKFLISPGYGLTPFGFTPRSHLMLLTMPIFILWLMGKTYSSFIGLLVLLFVHNSMAFVLLPFFLATDIMFRFRKIFRLDIFLIVTTIVLTYIGREQLFNITHQKYFLLGALIPLILSIYFHFKSPLVLNIAGSKPQPILRLCVSISALWLLVFSFLFFFSLFLPDTNFPVWYIFPGRSLALLRPLIILGVTLYFLGLVKKNKLTWAHGFKVTLLSFFLIYFSAFHQIGRSLDFFTNSLKADVHTLELKSDLTLGYTKKNERFFYYRLLKISTPNF